MAKLFAPLIILLSVWSTIGFAWEQCSGVAHSGTLTALQLSACTEDQLPCILKKGTTASIKLSFKPGNDTTSLSVIVTARLAGIDLPFPGFDSDACNPQYGIKCPLSKDVEYTYSNEFKIHTVYPNIKNVTTKWQFQDENNAVIVCVEIPTSIVD